MRVRMRMADFHEAAHHSRSRPAQCSRSSANFFGPCSHAPVWHAQCSAPIHALGCSRTYLEYRRIRIYCILLWSLKLKLCLNYNQIMVPHGSHHKELLSKNQATKIENIAGTIQGSVFHVIGGWKTSLFSMTQAYMVLDSPASSCFCCRASRFRQIMSPSLSIFRNWAIVVNLRTRRSRKEPTMNAVPPFITVTWIREGASMSGL